VHHSRDWLRTPASNLLAWWIPQAAILVALFAPTPVRTVVWTWALPAPSAVDEPENDEKQYGSESGGDNGRDDSAADVDSQLRKQPTADESADDPEADVRNETVAGTPHNLAGQPSRDKADQQNYQNAFS
jgi:hypothetical protein